MSLPQEESEEHLITDFSKLSSDAKQPRICLLIGAYYPIVGGAETHARLLCKGLKERGVDLFVVTRVRKKGLKKYELIDGIPVHRVWPAGFHRWGKYLMMFPAFMKLWSLRRDFDLIYVCGLRVLGVVGILTKIVMGKRCILRSESSGELSGGFIWDRPGRPPNKLLPIFARPVVKVRNLFLGKADLFLSIASSISEEYLQEKIAERKIRHIPNGIETDKFRPVPESRKRELRTAFNIPDMAVFIYTGKLNCGKGLELLLRAFKRFGRSYNQAHLLLVGGGDFQFLSCEKKLREYVRVNEMEDSVTFTGYTESVLQYLQASDYFVLPSESEALSISLIEAMSCALPSISTRAGGLKDLVDHNKTGLQIDINDEEALSASMEFFVANPDKARKIGVEGRRKIQKHYDIGIIADCHKALFLQLACGAGTRGAERGA